jgi:hypothetical protein
MDEGLIAWRELAASLREQIQSGGLKSCAQLLVDPLSSHRTPRSAAETDISWRGVQREAWPGEMVIQRVRVWWKRSSTWRRKPLPVETATARQYSRARPTGDVVVCRPGGHR